MNKQNKTSLTTLLDYINKANSYYKDALIKKDTPMRQRKLDYHGDSLNLFANEVLNLIKSGMEHNIPPEKLAQLTKYANWEF